MRRSRPSSRKYCAPPPDSELSLFTRPVVCAYWPLRIEAREGQHREVVAKALEKFAPLVEAQVFGVVGAPADHQPATHALLRVRGQVHARALPRASGAGIPGGAHLGERALAQTLDVPLYLLLAPA